MSGQDPPDDPPSGDKPKPRLRLVGKKEDGPSAKPSQEQIYQLYMASTHIEWTPFAKSLGWSPTNSRTDLPVDQWTRAKRDVIAREQAETLSEMVFDHKGRWHQDVLKTLKEYPEAHDAMFGVLKRRLGEIIKTIQDDDKNRASAMQSGLEFFPAFEKIDSYELSALARGLKVATEAKHRSLMIGDWSFNIAESFSNPDQFAKEQQKEELEETWVVDIKGGENISSKDMQNLINKYYDKPPTPHTTEEVKAVIEGDNE